MIIGIMEYIMLMFFIIGVGWMNEFDKNGLKFFEEKMFLNLVWEKVFSMRDVDFDICWFLYVEYFINVFFMMELIVCLVCCFLLVYILLGEY